MNELQLIEGCRKGERRAQKELYDDNTAELIQPDSSAISDMSAAELMNLVKELPVGFRTVFNMFAIEGYSHKEISEMLNITESTSRSQYTRAKQLLQRRINALY